MNHPNLQELATRIHEANKAAGWWDIPRPRVQTAWLVVTELAEATEAERAGKYADLEAFEAALIRNDKAIQVFDNGRARDRSEAARISMWAGSFKDHIKDTFEDEIADAVIRLLDFAASEGLAPKMPFEHQYPIAWQNEESFFAVSTALASALRPGRQITEGIDKSLLTLCAVAFCRKFDLWQHVELKLKYNATRPKMHGG